jgi:hypothetical protein
MNHWWNATLRVTARGLTTGLIPYRPGAFQIDFDFLTPTAASFDADLGEFVLPYTAVRTAADPDAVLLEFLQSTYEAAAEQARWNRSELERHPGASG